jgi:hypothetical protein
MATTHSEAFQTTMRISRPVLHHNLGFNSVLPGNFISWKPWFKPLVLGFKPNPKSNPKLASNHDLGLVWFQKKHGFGLLVYWFQTKPRTSLFMRDPRIQNCVGGGEYIRK